MPNLPDAYNSLENENWNFAKQYSNGLLMHEIIKIYEYEKIARFGVINFEDQYNIDPNILTQAKIDAMKWAIDELILLISNSVFAIKKNEDKIKMLEYKTNLYRIKKIIPICIDIINIRGKTSIKINEENFSEVLKTEIGIKEAILDLMNRSDLIFIHSEDFDFDQWKKNLGDDLIQGG